MSEWETYKLDDLAEKIGMGPFGSNIKVSTFVPEGIPVISGAHLNGVRVEDKEFNFITSEHADALMSSNVFRGDVVFTHAGNIGQASFIPENSEYERYIISQRQFYLRCDRRKLLPEFIAYYFKSREGQYKLLANRSSTGVPSIARPVSYLKSIEVTVPPPPEQRRIAAVLSTLDAKIDLLRRQNATLEAIAQALFERWFVDFEFPNEQGRPYKSAGGPMQPSELGEIPVGWRVGRLGEIAKNIRVNVQADDIPPDALYIGLEHMPKRQIALDSWGTAQDLGSNKSQFQRGHILFGKLRPYFHKVGVAFVDGVCSTDILVITSKKREFFGLVLATVSSVQFVKYVSNASEGTRMPRTSWQYMSDYVLAVPDKDTAKLFNNLIFSFVDKMENNITQIRTLTRLRDTLLPRLMSGRLRVQA